MVNRKPKIITTENGVTIIGTKNLAGELATTASMLYSNNMTTFLSTLVDEGEIRIDMDDAILVGAPEGDDFYVSGMGGVLLCHEGAVHPKQTRLSEVVG